VSRERARRREERERQRAVAAERQARRAARLRRRRALVRSVRRVLPRAGGSARPAGHLAQRRRAQNGVIATTFAAVQVLTWLLSGTWMVRFAVLVVSILALPVLVTLILDRRS
jgi:hypothetical protein